MKSKSPLSEDPVRKFRKRIVLLLSGLYLISIAAILIIFNVTYRQTTTGEIDQVLMNHLLIISHEEMQSTTPAASSASQPTDPTGSAGTNYSITEIYTVKEGNSGAEVVDRAPDSTLTEREIRNVGNAIFSKEETKGTWSHYRFLSVIQDGAKYVTFTDISMMSAAAMRLSLRSLFIGIMFLVIWIFVSYKISAFLVRPMQEAIDKQTDFLMMASHELKTPLTVTKTSLEMMQKEGASEKYLNYALEENAVMTDIVTDLLDLTKIDLQKTTMEQMNLSDCVTEAVLPFEVQAFEKGVTLEERIDDNITIHGSNKLLLRLVSTLTDNAIRHTEENHKVIVQLKSKTLTVKNEGLPIPEEERQKLFEKFYQSPNEKATTDGQHHYGMGLAIAQSIAREHRTQITIDCIDGWNIFQVPFS